MPLYQMVNDGKFRQDLLYRINTVEILLPPLRDRVDDIPALMPIISCKSIARNIKCLKNESVR
jgi:transcriptional regulator with PAS, ATPase and Fis domain